MRRLNAVEADDPRFYCGSGGILEDIKYSSRPDAWPDPARPGIASPWCLFGNDTGQTQARQVRETLLLSLGRDHEHASSPCPGVCDESSVVTPSSCWRHKFATENFKRTNQDTCASSRAAPPGATCNRQGHRDPVDSVVV